MAATRWIKRNRSAEYRRFLGQKALVEHHFPCFRCQLYRNRLTCKATICPSPDCDRYLIRIRYDYEKVPRVEIRQPKITPSSKIHMYGCGALCLYDPRETPWQRTDNVHEKIIPWIAEWLVYYELYQIYGKWLGPEAQHGPNGKFQQVRT
jgi:hypothetical protein